MRQITDDDTITDNYVYARFSIDDIPPQVLKQISEAAYVEGFQDGAAQAASKWAKILDFEHPAHTPMTIEEGQFFHVVYNYMGNLVAYYYTDAEGAFDE